MRALLALCLAVVALLVACGGRSDVVVSLAAYGQDGSGPYKSKTISCQSSESSDCQLLLSLVSRDEVEGVVVGKKVAVLDPVPENAACSRQGGPLLQGKIQGDINGQEIDATFPAWRGGCEAGRWAVVSPLFLGLSPEGSFPIPG